MKKMNLKTKILISCILGVIGATIAFPITWDRLHLRGNTTEEINQVERAIEEIFQKRDEIDFFSAWGEIKRTTKPLIYKNERIAAAKVLLYYKEYPRPKDIIDRFVGPTELWKLWEERHTISNQDWKIQTTTSRILISSGVAILTGIGTVLCVFLVLTIIPLFWWFVLQRINELSRAIQGKINP